MSEKTITPWINLFHFLEQSYRATVVEIALSHHSHASTPLRNLAKKILTEWINVHGFRSNWMERAPLPQRIQIVSDAMKRYNVVAGIIVCLWAEAKEELLSEIRLAAESSGLQFKSEWDWTDAGAGFHPPGEVPELDKFIEELASKWHECKSEDLHLGAFWWSRAVIQNDLQDYKETMIIKPQGSEQETTDMALDNNVTETKVEFNLAEQSLEIDEPISVTQLTALQEDSIAMNSPSLLDLGHELLKQSDNIQDIFRVLIENTEKLGNVVKKSDYAQAITLYKAVGNDLNSWNQLRERIQTLLNTSNDKLVYELERRPDLLEELGPPLALSSEIDQDLSPIVDYACTTIEKINHYDRRKEALLRKLEQLYADILKTQSDIDKWQLQENISIGLTFVEFSNPIEIPLIRIHEVLENVEKQKDILSERLKLLDEANIKHIEEILDDLATLNVTSKAFIQKNITLVDLQDVLWKEWSIVQRKELEHVLTTILEDQIAQQKTPAISELALSLEAKWDIQAVVDLLKGLARLKYDEEAALLLMALNITRPFTQTMVFSSEVFNSLLTGIEKFANNQDTFLLINRIASDFFNGWRVEDTTCKLRLCFTLLIAHYTGASGLPEGILWNIEPIWPVPEMVCWSKLWESVRDGIPLEIDIEDHREYLHQQLLSMYQKAQLALSRETTGVYSRSRSIQDRKYRALINAHLLPHVESRFNKLIELVNEVDNSSCPNKKQLTTLQEILFELKQFGSDDNLRNVFDRALIAAGMSNYHAFHGRTTLSNFRECLQLVEAYANQLVEYWSQQIDHSNRITLSPLLEEVTKYLGNESPVYPLAELVMRHLSKKDISVALIEDAVYYFEHALLGRTVFARRIPRVVANLTNEPFKWDVLLQWLLVDLTEPVDTADLAADILLERGASNQALLLIQHLGTDKQNLARRLSDEQAKQVEDLRTELLKAGGDPGDLREAIALGRWSLVQSLLTYEIEKSITQLESQRLRLQQRSMDLRRRINKLDEQLFELKLEIPEKAYNVLESSLAEARRTLSKSNQIEIVDNFVSDMEYRLTHQSWGIIELENVVQEFKNISSGKNQQAGYGKTIEQVIQLLQQNAITELGLDENSLDRSRIDTRCSLLHEWLHARDQISKFQSRDLDQVDRQRIL